MKTYQKKPGDRPSKIKRLIALFGVILLAALYLLLLFCALTDSADTMAMFKAAVLATVLIPVLLWAYTLIFRVVQSQSKPITFEDDEEESSPEESAPKK